MKRVWLTVLACLSLAAGCLNQQPAAEPEMRVAVTILPQAEFVERIGGDSVQVTVMIPPGASPHTYEPTPSQLTEVSEAALYAKVGSGIEFELAWMAKIIDLNRNLVVVDCSKGIELMHAAQRNEDEHEQEDHEGGYDPHIWLSPKNVRIMVENIYEGLIQVDPAHAETYTKNKEAYLQELDDLDTEIVQALSGKHNRKIMVYHPSWAYFCRDYGLEQVPIEEEGKEPTPRGIARLIEQAKAHGITVIFASPQFSTESAEVIAREIGGKVVLLNPLDRDYIENMRKVAQAFAEA